MKTEYKYNPPIPYSLHDMVVNKITIDKTSILLEFEHGYQRADEPYNLVEGNIIINGVDFDFVCVNLQRSNESYGKCQCENLYLNEFIKRFDRYNFEIIDEFYGYNKVLYSGYLSIEGEKYLIEMDISIYFTGNIVYLTNE